MTDGGLMAGSSRRPYGVEMIRRSEIFVNVPTWPSRFDIKSDCIATV